ncbi:MAG: putative motility protein [Candidatus Thiodiazotropha sp.]
MDVSGASSPSASMLANMATRTEISIAAQKKEMEVEKQIAQQLVATIEESAPKANDGGAVGTNIDVMV